MGLGQTVEERTVTSGWRRKLDSLTMRRLGRPVSHLGPRYIKDRAGEALHRKRFPEDPWMGAETIELLDRLLDRSDRCIEFGAGFSTAWLATRTASLVTIEHSPIWAETVSRSLEKRGLDNVQMHLVGDGKGAPSVSHYLAPVHDLGPGTFDFALVDGLHRYECVEASVALLAGGGLLVLDNAERYLPSTSRSPQAIRGPVSDEWLSMSERLAPWRHIWISNGVSDTAIFIKPCIGRSPVSEMT